jgi:hypothetical protein
MNVLSEISKAVVSDFAMTPPPEVIALFPDNPENAPKQVISFDKLREIAYKVLTVETTTGELEAVQNAKKSALRRARTDLFKCGFIGVLGSDYVWLVKKDIAENMRSLG